MKERRGRVPDTWVQFGSKLPWERARKEYGKNPLASFAGQTN